ncbi:MAG: radical SAM protein [Clostridia bacterium]|nr:radical SAM protein [Clostridia bacterium]
MDLKNCTLCPRSCGVDRTVGKKGICGMSDTVMLARAALHMWEEPVISGSTGSGTVFFSGCALKCVYCQNKPVSRGSVGKAVTVDRLCEIYFELKAKGAANINLVTPDHYIPQVADSLRLAKSRGLGIPVVYNTSSYVNAESLTALEGLADIYLPDMKYMDSCIAKKYSLAPDYPETAKKSIDTMIKQAGKPVFDGNGMMMAGVIVRHLVLPGNVLNSKKVLRYLHDTYGDSIYISIMSQYTPCTNLEKFPEINRRVTIAEYNRVVDYAYEIGIKNAFVQEGEAASESFIPAFDCEGV